MNKFTAQELSDFYQQVADGGEVEFKSLGGRGWRMAHKGPALDAGPNNWRIKPTEMICTRCDKPITGTCVGDGDGTGKRFAHTEKNKPTKKVIDLSVLIASQIDCEFSAMGGACFNRKLINIAPTKRFDGLYQDDHNCFHERCQPRMNHIHAWQGAKCPIEGFVVRAWVNKEDFLTIHTSDNFINWNDVVYVEFLEVEHGYVMSWEVSGEHSIQTKVP